MGRNICIIQGHPYSDGKRLCHALAASYVQAWLAAHGAKPAGAHGGWLQSVPLLRATAIAERCELVLSGPGGEIRPAYETEWLATPSFAAEAGEVDAPLVFVGFGIHAPAFGHDDYAGLDVRGKVVVTLRGDGPTSMLGLSRGLCKRGRCDCESGGNSSTGKQSHAIYSVRHSSSPDD